ncbi:hypothetical protein QVD17_10642 [Tagetes erecta]|uniref:Uncharacterized protein n=1 Tax=Tagetes erecta TaxID=13708 RepID=A0AAD8P6D5_TARER|nr:hypothetical protein QVD17_10642 [Tagetes erecta]
MDPQFQQAQNHQYSSSSSSPPSPTTTKITDAGSGDLILLSRAVDLINTWLQKPCQTVKIDGGSCNEGAGYGRSRWSLGRFDGGHWNETGGKDGDRQ